MSALLQVSLAVLYPCIASRAIRCGVVDHSSASE
jgi:hypothetical protein